MRLSTALLAVVLTLAAPVAYAADHAVALLYHRFGDATHPSTNVDLAQFEAHLDLLATNDYSVLPLIEIVRRLRTGDPLPERAVAITIDDAHHSIYSEAWPRMRARGLPFTVFLETDALDQKRPQSLSWEQVHEMAAAGVDFAPHSASHPHLTDVSDEQLRAELFDSRARLAEAVPAPSARLFAYPFGESDDTVRRAVREAGYVAAFGQHSGVIHGGDDRFALPRFAVTGGFAGIERFSTVIGALPFPVELLAPEDDLIRAAAPLELRLRPLSPATADAPIACYASDGRKPEVHRSGDTVRVTVARGFAPGRARINCTQPVGDGRWRWFGRQFTVRDFSGATPPE